MSPVRPHAPVSALAGTPRRRAVCLALHVVAAAGAATGAVLPAPVQAAAAAVRSYDIPAGPLGAALQRFAAAAGVSVSAPPELLEGVSTAGVQGPQTVPAALQILLAGTGLDAVAISLDAYTLRRRAPEAGGAVSTLAAITVTGSSEVTEDSGSYLAPATRAANRLSGSLRETPQSVTVLTRQRLEDMGSTSVRQALGQVTGVYATENDTERTSFSSRGYAISNYQIDGISLVQGDGYISLNPDPAVYDRIDIVRGATGLMTGAGDPSGSVNLQRKRPTRDFQASVGATLGRWDTRRVEADLSGPIAFDGKIRGRLVAVREKADAFRDRYTLDKKVLYGVLEADVGERTTVSVGYDYQAPRTYGVTWGTVPYWMADGSLANLPRNTNWSPAWASWALVQKQAFGTIEHRFDNGWQLNGGYIHDVKTGSGKRWFAGSGYPKADGTGISAWTGGGAEYDITTQALDLNASGPVELFGRRHELVFGYTSSRSVQDSPYSVMDPMPPSYTVVPDWRNFDPDIPEYGVTVYDFNQSETETRQRGAYAAGRFSLADPLTVIVGARLSNWRAETRNYNVSNGGSYASATGYSVDNELTPYAGVILDLNRQWSVYGSYTDIFKPQNRRDADNAFLDPVTGNNVELGLKGELFEGRMNAAFVVFGGKQDNLAELDDSRDLAPGSFDPADPPEGYDSSGHFLLPDGSQPYKSTGKGNKVRGFEAELQGQVTDNWNLAAGFTYTKVRDADGNQIQGNRPVRLLRVWTSYRLPGDWNRLTVGGGVTWQSAIWANASRPTGAFNANGTPVTQTARIEQGSFALVNLMARYDFTENFSAALHVNNVFDKHYYRNVGFYNGVHWGEPRTWLLSAKYRF
ncbi:TonB-dependent siderophore receptor [Verticiella sediminum]|uniref:TonB-dependent siderophore receptor n=1 Tax=Verticiella sediminum TaxID=1247510 RepID=A0A556B0A0_9BURK|nr:TonB-dependent siderophore receptor [Verticiella sediminum]TSH98618.1 TonB-dependent siderophore receptor [Verticiella sediminum]